MVRRLKETTNFHEQYITNKTIKKTGMPCIDYCVRCFLKNCVVPIELSQQYFQNMSYEMKINYDR